MDFNVNLKITIDETPALMNTLAAFCSALQDLKPADFEKTFGQQAAPQASAPAAAPVQQQLMPQAPVAPQPSLPVTQAQQQAAVPASAPKQYTLAEIQAACAPLMDAGKMNELAAVMQEMGVSSLMELPQEKYGELAVKLRTMGARL